MLPFKLLEVPASGAFGTLVVAQDQSGETVALKVLKKKLSQNVDAVTRLRDEARMLCLLEHKNIVRVKDLLHIEGRQVLVMEWVQGLDLGLLLRSFPDGLPLPVAADLIRQASLALDTAYKTPKSDGSGPLAIIHRDVKPENFLLSIDGVLKTLDFGQATANMAEREAQTKMIVLGSRGFIAPERLLGEPISPAVDTYALGISFFQLITGKPALISLKHDRHDQAVRDLLERIPEDPLGHERTVHMRHLFRRMCLYEPTLRPSHQEVAHEIATFLNELMPDMAAFAAEFVRPIHENRKRKPPSEHPDFAELQFLSTCSQADSLRFPNTSTQRCDLTLTRFLETKSWHERLNELQLLLISNPLWTENPFIEILKHSQISRWKFWASRTPDEQINAALYFLRQRPTSEAIKLAESFLTHPNEKVSENAALLNEQEPVASSPVPQD